MTATTRSRSLIWMVTLLASIIMFATSSVAMAASTTTVSHKIVRGDTLYELALKHKTTVNEIARLNDLDPDDVLPLGKVIRIPSKVAQSAAAPEAAVPAGEVRLHKIGSGDTLSDLAIRYGTTVSAIAAANNMSSKSLLRLGSTLRIPGKAVVAETTEPKPEAPAAAPPQPAALASRGSDGKGAVPMTWDEVNKLYVRGAVAQVIDVRTGETFNIRRHGGTLHADVEPVTKKDTETMRRLWGGWSWSRRPVVVLYKEYRIAGSMNGMPHGRESIGDNGILGHVCLHVLNSRLHLNKRLDATHQAAVKEATGR